MAKYYIASGDLKKIISTRESPKIACKRAIQEFMEENKGSQEKSISTKISISEQGYRLPNNKVQFKNDDVVYFDVVEILDLIP